METKFGTLILELLTEARRQDLPYTEKKTKQAIDKVIVTLEGNHSGKFTKLAKRFKDLKAQTEALSASTDVLNAEIKENAIDLFDAADEIYTRIVETVSMTILIGRRQPDSIEKTSIIDYKAIIAEITLLVPELTEQIEKIIEANTKTEEKTKIAKSPQLRVDLKEDFSIEAIIKFAKSVGRQVLSNIKSWGRGYDKRVKDLRARTEALSIKE